MTDYSVKALALNKYFGRRLIFRDLNFDFRTPGIYGIAGANGSGKSTLVKIIAGLNSPSSGKIVHTSEGKDIKPENLHNHLGFVSPYLILYDEFSAIENLTHFANIRGIEFNKEKADYLLALFLLSGRRNDLVKEFSSGMKQRLKFIFALIHSPEIIILDEPTSNLDNEGKEKVYTLVRKEAESSIIIIASNEAADLAVCSSVIYLENFKN